ncbi:hypothetical protein ACF0H5_009285 [Mactra antiquata]
MFLSTFFLTLVLICGSYGAIVRRQAPSTSFTRAKVGTVTAHEINEASGLGASRKHPGFLYTHNDHGGGPEIYVIDASSGNLQATLTLVGVTYNDYEDLTVGRCAPGNDVNTCIYIADVGDGGAGAVNNVYRIPEPDTLQDQTIQVSDQDKLEFTWNQIDCETLMIGPDANLYIISKVDDAQSTIAQLPYTAWGTNTRVDVTSTAMINIQSTKKDPVSGDISFDGTEVLVKAKHAMFYWNAQDASVDYVVLLSNTPGVHVEYIDEPQGEAVCWDTTGQGYYTLSEGLSQPLYYYARN